MSDQSALPFPILLGAMKAAAEETRLRMLALLSEGELTVSDMTDILGQSQPRISRHLKLLAEAGIVEAYAIAGEAMACNMMDEAALDGVQAFIDKRRPG